MRSMGSKLVSITQRSLLIQGEENLQPGHELKLCLKVHER